MKYSWGKNPNSRNGFKKGQIPWNKGIPNPLAKNLPQVFKKGEHLNENHPNWKGDEVGYTALHKWVARRLGKASKCINGHIDNIYYWGNISGEYKRDLNDWYELCRKCNFTDGIRKHKRFLYLCS